MQIQTTGNLTTWAADINAAHQAAESHADKAMGYAKQAGELLLVVKQKLPHGEFGNWVDANINVTQRQAQRYIAAAQGKPVSVPVATPNTTSMSYLPEPVKTDTVPDLHSPIEVDQEAPPDYTELDYANDQINELQAELVVARMGDVPEDQKTQAAELIAEMKREINNLRAYNKALTISRDTFQTEAYHLKKQVLRERRLNEKLTRKAA